MRYSGVRYDGLLDLCEYSPHLMMYIERLFSLEDLIRVNSVFAISVLFGGLREIDFSRPATEVKYNPRPARVALILMRDAGIKDLSMVCVAIAACVIAEPGANLELSRVLDSREMELARVAASIDHAVRSGHVDCSDVNISRALVVGMSILLDRVRHFHRHIEEGGAGRGVEDAVGGENEEGICEVGFNGQVTSTISQNELMQELVCTASRFVEAGKELSPSLCRLLEHWLKRVERMSVSV